MIRLVIFDLDDTLYPERDFVLSGFRAAAAFAAPQLGLPARAILRALLAAFREDRRGVFDRAIAHLAPARAELVPALIGQYREHEPVLCLPAASERALAQAARRGHTALISDGLPAQQRRKLAALGLADRFDLLLLTGELGDGCGKPSPRPFQRAADHFGLPPADAIYLSDNPAKDFRGPNRLGMPSVRVRRPRGVYADLEAAPGWDATVTVGSLAEAMAAVERL